MKLAKEKKDIFYLFLSGILTFFPNLWVDKANLMEARNFVTAREMVRHGNWIITTMNGEYRFEKPPLPTWITAFFMKIFGTTSNEYVLRLPVAILSLGLIFLIYFIVKSATGSHKLAFISGLVSSTTFMLIKLGNDNTWDMFAYVLMFGCVSFLFQGIKYGGNKYFLISGIFLAGSFLSKGPVSLYGMMLPFFMSYMLVYGTKGLRRNVRKILMSLLIGVFLAGIWPMAAFISQKELFLFVMNKEANTWSSKHTESIFFYLDYVLYTGVWLVFVLASFFKTWTEKRSDDRKFFSFLFFWNLFSLILISLIKMKKKRYGIPLFILTPMMASHLIYYYLGMDWKELFTREKIMLKIHFLLMALISLSIPVIFFLMGYRKGLIGLGYQVITVMVFGLLFYKFILAIFSRSTLKKGIYFTGILMICVNIFAVWFVERDMRDGRRDSYKYLSSMKNTEEMKLPVYTISCDEITNVWNTGGKIEKLGDVEKLPQEFFVLESRDESNLKDFLQTGYVLEEMYTYYKSEGEDELIHLYKFREERDI